MSDGANRAGAESVAKGVYRKRGDRLTEFELNNSFGDYHVRLSWEKPPSNMARLKIRTVHDDDWFEMWLTPLQREALSRELGSPHPL